MRSSSSNSNALLDYVTTNRGRLDIEELHRLLNDKDLNINAQDQYGNTALHLLVDGGGTFEYAQLLLQNGANITIANNHGNTAFDIVQQMEERQPRLMFLSIVAIIKKEPGKNDFTTKKAAIFQHALDPKNPYQKTFLKLGRNYFDFSSLNWDEIDLLCQAKNNLSRKVGQETFKSDLGFENDDLVKIFQDFLSNFSGMIELERARQIVEEHNKTYLDQDPLQFIFSNVAGNPNEASLPIELASKIRSSLDQLSKVNLRSAIPGTHPEPAKSESLVGDLQQTIP